MHESMLQRRSKNAYIRNQEFLITLKIDLKIWNLQQGLIGFESFLIKGELPLQISTMLPGTSLSEKDRSEIFLFGRSCTKIKKELFSMTMSKARAASQVRKWQTFPRKFMLICMKCAFCSYCQSIWAMWWIYPHNTRFGTQIWEYQFNNFVLESGNISLWIWLVFLQKMAKSWLKNFHPSCHGPHNRFFPNTAVDAENIQWIFDELCAALLCKQHFSSC